MPNHVVFLVHGMGAKSLTKLKEPLDKRWADPVIAQLKRSWNEFDNLKQRKIDDIIRFVPITYDQVFHSYLVRLANEATRQNKLLGDTKLAKLGIIPGSYRDKFACGIPQSRENERLSNLVSLVGLIQDTFCQLPFDEGILLLATIFDHGLSKLIHGTWLLTHDKERRDLF